MSPADFSGRYKGAAGFLKLFFLGLAALFLGTCGLEDYPYIEPVPQGNISQELNNRAVVNIPGSNTSAFSNFAIFYRIYVSDIPVETTTSGISNNDINNNILYTINEQLYYDYKYFSPYIDSDTQVNSNMDSLFQGKSYKYLTLQNADIDSVLSSSALGKTLVFYFPPGEYPTMTIGSNSYILWRSTGTTSGTFVPQPDRNFVNSDDLWKSDYINANMSADVVDKSNISPGDSHYTYAAMFIVAVGFDDTNYSSIYSTPSLIHVFQLQQF